MSVRFVGIGLRSRGRWRRTGKRMLRIEMLCVYLLCLSSQFSIFFYVKHSILIVGSLLFMISLV